MYLFGTLLLFRFFLCVGVDDFKVKFSNIALFFIFEIDGVKVLAVFRSLLRFDILLFSCNNEIDFDGVNAFLFSIVIL